MPDVSSPGEAMFNLSTYPDLPSKYQLRQLLGEGAFSSVYKGVKTDSKEQVAIKIINKTNLTSKQLNNIQNEINIMNKLTNAGGHVNILRLIESFESEENCFLVLEYSDGGEIFNKIIEYTYFSENLAKHVFFQLLNAIRFLHQNNVVHRDIKPENLLFNRIPHVPRTELEIKKALRASDDESKKDEGVFKPGVGGGGIGTIKLADFGLAKQLRYDIAAPGKKQSNLKTPCGTAGYTAPEVIHCGVERKRRFKSSTSKSNFYSKAVDIWSLGCFLYTVLCGFPPFYDDNHDVLTHKIITADYVFLEPWWDEVSEDAKDLISKMLVVDPEARITLDEIYEHPWLADAVSLEGSSYFPESTPSDSNNDTLTVDNAAKSDTHSNGGLKSPGGILTPGAAIRSVFNNPAMSHVNLKSLAHHQRHLDPKEGVDPRDVKFNAESGKGQHRKSSLPKTPNPMENVNFKDVFEKGGDSDSDELSSDVADFDSDEEEEEEEVGDEDVDDEEEEEAEGEDQEGVGELKDKLTNLKLLSISSTSSTDSSKLSQNDDDCATRSSSVISGVNGDYKFTLNLNDSNLLRRRSSVKSGQA
ncbi:hypothetical protein FT663_00004 [Candidozyma haemuli var. vulneris]|uniref:Protein kinase domain-containing protein n=1 Tax=Candidozyma haemuli TaxID=45357 RepID=A0A2V1AWT7_9ASCO|nr:hypothetical protein CXQ85_000794 [[Candida] haemuloni]KAF3993984.1 hypothetical protein FT662_00170 [[Candida] haemuloni var. vulneris]KAF3995781.1 hypothetical protein FT663_00004 [[Candida] haemuloni var. vulneris]PVH21803.1 hypothetical protein CXQ85_000794 [[Candida] haemuloni]